MNETVLALMSALAIYGLSSLALTRTDGGASDDLYDVHASETAETASTANADDESSLDA
jgi:hypothetical protein